MKSKYTIAVLGAFMAVAGCGPIYDTQYDFVPPETSVGRTCIYQCENSQQQCRALQEDRAQDCEYRAEQQKNWCEEDIYRRKGREPKWYECGSESCSVDYDRCDALYRSCYQACGGTVRAETRCVLNCDQVPPGKKK